MNKLKIYGLLILGALLCAFVTVTLITKPRTALTPQATRAPFIIPTLGKPKQWATLAYPTSPPITYPPLPTRAPTRAPAHLVVPAGQLAQYKSDYFKYETISVAKKDGTIDERANDLEELCRDYIFYRDKIAKGDKSAQSDFNQTNQWLNAYDESDIQTMMAIVEGR